jgi:hypothetical protein
MGVLVTVALLVTVTLTLTVLVAVLVVRVRACHFASSHFVVRRRIRSLNSGDAGCMDGGCSYM